MNLYLKVSEKPKAYSIEFQAEDVEEGNKKSEKITPKTAHRTPTDLSCPCYIHKNERVKVLQGL
jgi:hypothetical protein